MKTSETIKEIAPALVKAIGAIQGASKDGKNPHFKSSYATLSSVVDAARLPLMENGICVIQDQGGITEHNTVVLTTRLLHSSGEWIDTVCEAKPKSFTPQDIGSSITYLRRYGLMSAVNMPAEDDDGNSASQGKQQADVKTAASVKKNGNGKTPATRAIYKDLSANIEAAGGDLDALQIWAESEETKAQIAQLPADWQNDVRGEYRDAKLAATAAMKEAA